MIDDFLIHYAGKQDKLLPEINQQLSKFKHLNSQVDSNWFNFFKMQYIAHCIFKKDGLIGKYIHHSALKGLTAEERNYLENSRISD